MKKTFALLNICLIFVFSGCINNAEVTEKSVKNITVQIICNEINESISLTTEADFLGEALSEENLISGEKGQYGMFITAVKGISADENKNEWWCITKGDEPVMTGVDLTPVSDGDLFKITLKEGY